MEVQKRGIICIKCCPAAVEQKLSHYCYYLLEALNKMTGKQEVAIESVKTFVRKFVKQLCPHEINAFEMSFGQLTNWPHRWQHVEPTKWRVEDLLSAAMASGYAFPGIIPEEIPSFFRFALVVYAVTEHFRRLGKVPEVDEIEATYKDFSFQSELPKDASDDAKSLAIKFVQSYFQKQPTPLPMSSEETLDIHLRKPSQIKITFTITEVTVDVGDKERKSLKRRELLRLAEYVVFKKEVYWPWACVILSEFNVDDPDGQFRNYISTANGILKNYGIRIQTHKKKTLDGRALFYDFDSVVVSNIRTVRDIYKEAYTKYYKKENVSEAIKILARITEDPYYTWYTYTDAYMDLAEWIRQRDFKGKEITDKLIERCQSFLKWYMRALKRGIERINGYIRKNRVGKQSPLSYEAEKVFSDIKTQLKNANSLYSDFTNRYKPPSEEKQYQDLMDHLLSFRRGVEEMEEEAEKKVYDRERMVEKERKVDTYSAVVKAIKDLYKKNPTVHDIINHCRDSICEIIPHRQRPRYSEKLIKELREDKIYLMLGEVIFEAKAKDLRHFDLLRANKLQNLVAYLRGRLIKKLEQDIKH